MNFFSIHFFSRRVKQGLTLGKYKTHIRHRLFDQIRVMHIDDLEFKRTYFPDKLKFADNDEKIVDIFANNMIDLNNFPRIVAEVILAEPMRLALKSGNEDENENSKLPHSCNQTLIQIASATPACRTFSQTLITRICSGE